MFTVRANLGYRLHQRQQVHQQHGGPQLRSPPCFAPREPWRHPDMTDGRMGTMNCYGNIGGPEVATHALRNDRTQPFRGDTAIGTTYGPGGRSPSPVSSTARRSLRLCSANGCMAWGRPETQLQCRLGERQAGSSVTGRGADHDSGGYGGTALEFVNKCKSLPATTVRDDELHGG